MKLITAHVGAMIGLGAMATASIAIGEEPRSMQTARRLASTRYKGWTYGSRNASQKIDCSQFMLAVVEDLKGEPLSKEMRSLLVISGVGGQDNLGRLVSARDQRTKGVVAAIVSLKVGMEIVPSEVQPGDFIQYWYRSNGKWAGHTAIVVSVRENGGKVECRLYGSHQSSNGIAVSKYWVSVTQTDKVVYLARLRD